MVNEMLKHEGQELAGKTVIISGSGNVAIYATEKAQQLGAKVVALSDSNGYVYDKDGIKLDVVKEIDVYKRQPGSHLPSHAVSSIVLSAVWGLTVVFGMGTGVSPIRIATRYFLP